MILTVPSPVVAKKCRSGDSAEATWLEKVVAFVWIGCGCGARAVYVVCPGFKLADALFTPSPLDRMIGDEGDWTEIGIKVSS